VKKVGVFVDEKIKNVKRIAEFLRLDFLQFHGEETVDYISKFSARKKYKIIKAFRIKDKKSLEVIPEYKNVDLYLLDTYVKTKKGGTGETFNWDFIYKLKGFKKPLILSGGLNPKNIIRAIKKTRPYAVDVSSGIEKTVGKKDLRLMCEFIKKARYAAKLYCPL
jgi:phosphoribosylanthranilate isomerase